MHKKMCLALRSGTLGVRAKKCPNLDLLEGVFRLVQVLKREAHLVVQLG